MANLKYSRKTAMKTLWSVPLILGMQKCDVFFTCRLIILFDEQTITDKAVWLFDASFC